MEINGNFKKTSCMIDGTISCNFNLYIIYNHLEVKNDILYITYNNKKKLENKEEKCKSFNNQISIKLSNGMNIKIFSTGAFSISGAGNIKTALDNAKKYLNALLKKIASISLIKEITPVKYDIFYTYYTNHILTRTNTKDLYECKHQIKKNKIIINGKHCEKFDLVKSLYIQIKHTNKIKKLYNNMAEEIGYVEYITCRKTKSLCIKNCVFQKSDDFTYDIVNKYKTKIGVLKIHLLKSSNLIELPQKVKMIAKGCEDKPQITSIKFSNCNYNFQVNLKNNEFIDRDLICSYLESKNIKFTYDPCSYPGVKFTLFNTKITIFRTGSILLSSKEDIYKNVYPFLTSILNENILCKKLENSSQNRELTIWDI